MTEVLHPPFTVTPAAVDQLVTAGGTVRVDLAGTGCCGVAYAWTATNHTPGTGCSAAQVRSLRSVPQQPTSSPEPASTTAPA